ncbi:MAG: hypothetical protein ACI957_003859, partial [Verrucomicrobiales bacterium]
GATIQSLVLNVIGKGLNGSTRTDVSLALETPSGANQMCAAPLAKSHLVLEGVRCCGF